MVTGSGCWWYSILECTIRSYLESTQYTELDLANNLWTLQVSQPNTTGMLSTNRHIHSRKLSTHQVRKRLQYIVFDRCACVVYYRHQLNVNNDNTRYKPKTLSLTPIRFSNRSLGVIGISPPARPNILSNDCCTLSANRKHRIHRDF